MKKSNIILPAFVGFLLFMLCILVQGFLSAYPVGALEGKSYNIHATGLYRCLEETSTEPAQNGQYPPEGYHCRLYEGLGENFPEISAVDVREIERDDNQQELVTASTPVPFSEVIQPSVTETQATQIPTENSTVEPEETDEGKPDNPSPAKTPKPDDGSSPDDKPKKEHPNSGGGNGSEDVDDDGEDDDPGNSEGKNKGKD